MSNCSVHPEAPAAAFCRSCGKPLCLACQRFAQGTVFCEQHLPGPRTAPESPYASSAYSDLPPQPSSQDAQPGLAFLLGLIPGVGAIYNGQYAKGLVHLVIFGMLVSIVSSGAGGELQPLFGMLIPGWVLYMAFEAFHTARRRQTGQTVDEFSSLLPLHHQGPARVPVGPVVLIALGVLFLLNNLDILHFYMIVKYWPVALIALGVYLLYARITGAGSSSSSSSSPPLDPTNVVNAEVRHEQ